MVLRQVFYFGHQFRLIGREVRALHSFLQFSRLFSGLIGSFLLALSVVSLPIRAELSLRDGVTPTGRRPEPGEVRMPVG